MEDNESIFNYSRQEAIEDGVLVDMGQFPFTSQYFKFHTACTKAVWDTLDLRAIIVRVDIDELVLQLFSSAVMAIRNGEGNDTINFISDLSGVTFDFKVHCGPGDDERPVLTIMFLDED